MAAGTDDYSNIDEPRTNREMYQKIIRMIQEDGMTGRKIGNY